MLRPVRASCAGVLLLAIAVLVPAVALAGKTVVVRQQSLRVQVGLRPSRAGAKGVALRFRTTYANPKHPQQQPPYNTKLTIIAEPPGMAFHTSAVRKCRESTVLRANGNASVCPSSSKVGSGSVTVNARPSIKRLVTGSVTVYNGSDDGGYGGYRRGSPELVLGIRTSNGLNVANFLHVVRRRGGAVELVGKTTKPAKPGIAPGDYSLRKIDLTISSRKRFITNPPTCRGSWPFSVTITNWFGQPSITAFDSVKCRS